MIPVKLTVRNFMCYQENVPPLYFGGIHLACLSGDNGNGKSALIDAMTWALWGKTRTNSDDDLIHSHQTEMSVEFDFAVEQQLYRIIRKHSRPRKPGGRGQSDLQLQIKNADGFRPINGESITQTQQKIINILHMDYDTFTNSAYLRQGHADEFTRQASAKRKEVLGNILGLSRYDELEGQAKELAKQQGEVKGNLESSLAEIDSELAQKPAYEAQLSQAQGELSRIEAAAREKEAGLNELRQKKEALENQKAQLDDLEARLSHTAKDLGRWDEQVSQLRSRIKEYEAIIGRRAAIEEGYAQFTLARKMNGELDNILSKSIKLERRKGQLEKDFQEALNNLKTDHAVTRRDINNLEARAQKLPELRNQLNQAQAQMRRLAESEAALRQKELAIQELQTRANYLEAGMTRLEQEITELGEKLDLLASHTEARCPLCETELLMDGLKLIAAKYTAGKQDKSDLLKSNQAELLNRRAELESLQKEKTRQESWLSQEKTKAQSQASFLMKEIAEIEAADKQLAGLRKNLDDIEGRLAKKDFAVTEQAALAAIETELAGLGYDAEKHEQARQQLGRLEPFDHDQRRLEEAARLINQEKDAALRAEESARERRESLERDNKRKEALAAGLTLLPRLFDDLAKAETEHQTLARQRSQTQETVGSIKARLQRCTELEIKKKEKEGQLARSSKEEIIYRELAEAFGKRGIQALIIETALPEIEAEANRLLSRMTDNRMHLKFETQRETKKGSVLETLDINIADELGTRPYDNFSGGEAFRINFAIRIALSKLLARRAGAPLPTLIIDEGFGTQDNTGIEKLKEAITSIQGDFEKILVITHIEELRDAFPTRIDVIKNAEGSTISVS